MLQIDPANHYGGSWASLNLDELLSLLRGGSQSRQQSGAGGIPSGRPSAAAAAAARSGGPSAGGSGGGDAAAAAAEAATEAEAAAALVHGAAVYSTPGSDLGPPQAYNIDLAPKVPAGWGGGGVGVWWRCGGGGR